MRNRIAIGCCTAGLLVLAPTTASAEPVRDTPAGTGGGCKENGLAIAEGAQTARPFGATVVRENAPIAPLNAVFFTALCS